MENKDSFSIWCFVKDSIGDSVRGSVWRIAFDLTYSYCWGIVLQSVRTPVDNFQLSLQRPTVHYFCEWVTNEGE